MDVVCEDCGESNRADTEFCVFCGAYLSWAGGATAASPPPEAPAGPDTPTAVLPSVASGPPAEQRPTAEVRPDEPARAGTTAADRQRGTTLVRESSCPQCGRPNAPERYFCGRCGHQLVPSPAARRLPATRRREPSWWGRLTDDRDRLARRAYRQSLPAAYRWRRVVVGGLVVTLLATLAVVSRGRPVALVRSWVDGWRGTLVAVPRVTASVEPAELTLPPTTPGSLLDRTGQAWTTAWSASTSASSCGPAPGTPTIVLTFPPRRIRALEIYAGLSDTLPERSQQFRPATLAVVLDDVDCQTVALDDQYLSEKELRSAGPVTRMRIGVMTAHPVAAGGQDVLSISEIGLLSRPVR